MQYSVIFGCIRIVLWVTMSDNKYNEWQSLTMIDNEWQWVTMSWQWVTMSDNEWQWVTMSWKWVENELYQVTMSLKGLGWLWISRIYFWWSKVYIKQVLRSVTDWLADWLTDRQKEKRIWEMLIASQKQLSGSQMNKRSYCEHINLLWLL